MLDDLKEKIMQEFGEITAENYDKVYHYGLLYFYNMGAYKEHNTHMFKVWLNRKFIKINIYTLKTKGQVVSFLIALKTLNKDDFENRLSRKEMAHILNMLYPFYEKPFGKKMARNRQACHINHWLSLHGK